MSGFLPDVPWTDQISASPPWPGRHARPQPPLRVLRYEPLGRKICFTTISEEMYSFVCQCIYIGAALHVVPSSSFEAGCLLFARLQFCRLVGRFQILSWEDNRNVSV